MSPEIPPRSAMAPPSALPRAHILCLTGPMNLAAAAAAALRERFAESHVVEILGEPSDVSAVIRTLHRAGRMDAGDVEVVVVETASQDTAEAALLRTHWPAARWTVLGEPGTIPPPSRGLSPLSGTSAQTLLT